MRLMSCFVHLMSLSARRSLISEQTIRSLYSVDCCMTPRFVIMVKHMMMFLPCSSCHLSQWTTSSFYGDYSYQIWVYSKFAMVDRTPFSNFVFVFVCFFVFVFVLLNCISNLKSYIWLLLNFISIKWFKRELIPPWGSGLHLVLSIPFAFFLKRWLKSSLAAKKAIRAKQRHKFCSPYLAIMTSPFERNILEGTQNIL